MTPDVSPSEAIEESKSFCLQIMKEKGKRVLKLYVRRLRKSRRTLFTSD